jgi:hypothetical protein
MAFLLTAAARTAGGALKGVVQQQGKIMFNQGKKAAVNYAKTQGQAALNQGKKAAVNFTVAHRNQAIAATQNALKQKVGNLGRAANARINQTLGIKRPNNKRLNNVKR